MTDPVICCEMCGVELWGGKESCGLCMVCQQRDTRGGDEIQDGDGTNDIDEWPDDPAGEHSV